jgi:uncharacterized membrane protein YidH (DUF202 family)
MDRGFGVLLVVTGVVLVLLGILVTTGAMSWFGRLPGDIRGERGNTRVFIPITSMVLVSLVLTIVVNLVARWWR